MSFRYGQRSERHLRTAHIDLQRLFREVILHVDCAVLKGHRGEREQNTAFNAGVSELRFPEGKHNVYPSRAVDVAPYPIKWGERLVKNGRISPASLLARDRFYHFAGGVLGIAAMMRIPIRWGGNWDGNDLGEQKFNDLVHFELKRL